VLAEALAKEANTSPQLGFVSGGVSPAQAADPLTLEALAQEKITWRGKPKDLLRVGLADIYVLMGEDVELPAQLEKSRVIRWDIPSPGGKGPAAYRKTVSLLKEKIAGLMGEVSQSA
jgi:protein-tyrosine-phosphatase